MKRGIIMISICALSFCAQPAQAALITIEIEAEVDYVNDSHNFFEGRIKVGDVIIGSYTYESTAPDTNPSSYVGDYEHYAPPCGISLTVGGFEFKTDPANVDFLVEIINDSPWRSGGLHDAYWLISYNNLPLSKGTSVEYIYWLLRDHTASAIPNDVLPLTPPVLGDWEVNGLWIRGHPNSFFDIGAHVTSAIPEPSTIVLIALGGLFLKKRR